MPKVTRDDYRGKKQASVVGMEFFDVESLDVFSFCPDSNDATTPATQVHIAHRLKGNPRIPLVIRCHSPRTLDAYIESLIEHRTFVFGRREWRNDFPEQEKENGLT